jgi:hypothetical protein
VRATAGGRFVSVARTVHYRSRTGNYTVPAIITATVDSLFRPGVEAGHVADLSGEECVHLQVFTPGFPGTRQSADDFLVESPHGRGENINGSYPEYDVPFDPDGGPGTWSWPPQV